MTREPSTVHTEDSPSEFVTAVFFIGTAVVLGLSCPSAEEPEDWNIHYHRYRQSGEVSRT
jgi:hypothetical protein